MKTLVPMLALVALTLPACAAVMVAGRRPVQPPGTDYTIRVAQPQTQMLDVTVELRDLTAGEVELSLPVWRPGRYHVLDLAGAVQEEHAADLEGRALPVRKSDKATWVIDTRGASAIRFSYRVYCNELRTRLRHVDDSHAFISPSAVMVYMPGRRDQPVRVTLDLPEGWRVATGLSPEGTDPRVLVASNYDVLVDSPIEAGEHELIRFDVDGVPHEIAIWGRGHWDAGALARDFGAIVREEARIFGRMPYERFVYIIHAQPGSGGGTEHLNSTVMGADPGAFDDPDRYKNFLGLVSHEMFHTWNVKQLRPRGIHPYDYQHENYTDLLWVAEGTTSYFDDLVLARTGQITVTEYLSRLAGAINANAETPGRHVQSVAQSSFDAWIKFNKPTPNSRNATVDFYREGSLVSLAIDLELRRRTAGEVALDDAMRVMFEKFPLSGTGYTRDDLVECLETLSGGSFADFFSRHVEGTEPIDFASLLAGVGVVLERDKEGEEPWLGADLEDSAGLARVRSLSSEGPAFAAGLIVDDLLVALDGERLRASDLTARLKGLKPGDRVHITYFRYDLLREIDLDLGAKPAGRWVLKQADEPGDDQRRAFEAWLRRGWDGAAPAAAPANP
ncbi:MAG: M61 family metallopeptidase [Phycisphaerales bacterium]|nr:M61 family metallopeptidase [Phycisphaerales bacterium]